MAPENYKEVAFEYQEPNLDIPEPPGNLSYAELEDFRSREILKANGISLTEEGLLSALERTTNILQTAVAHTLGSMSIRAAVPALQGLLTSQDDLVKVEAAYALARLGV